MSNIETSLIIAVINALLGWALLDPTSIFQLVLFFLLTLIVHKGVNLAYGEAQELQSILGSIESHELREQTIKFISNPGIPVKPVKIPKVVLYFKRQV